MNDNQGKIAVRHYKCIVLPKFCGSLYPIDLAKTKSTKTYN